MEWKPDDSDEWFEREGDFFLSGLSDHMPARDMDYPIVFPGRHGCDSPHADNVMWDVDGALQTDMPFHPTCLEVFKRASSRLSGGIDIDGLLGWWTMEASYHAVNSFPRHKDVVRCREQWWEHYKGTEYLAANPVFVPPLDPILQSAVSDEPAFDPREGAFDVPEISSSQLSTDPFTTLPHELRMHILEYLTSKEVANLRLASRSFRQLPNSLWRDLLARELPFLWEAWSDSRYSGWATTTAKHLEAVWDRNGNHQIAPLMPVRLPPQQTNWYQLYCNITRHWKELMGLQNRKRIWRDCEEILKRAHLYRASGEIPARGSVPVKNVLALVKADIDRRIEENRERSGFW